MREMKDSGIEWIGEIPVDWKVCRVKFLADNNHLYPIGDGDHGMIKSSDYLDEGIPYIRVLNLTWCNGLNLDNLVFISEEMNRRVRNSELKPNDILVAKTGATIGKTAIVPMSLPLSNTTSHVGKISIAPIHSAKYFYYVMSSFVVQKQIRDISAMQSTRPELGIDGLKNLIVIVPLYTDQKQISDFLDTKCAEIDALSSDIQAQIDTLEQYKRSVIFEAVTKGLDPNVPMKDSGIEWVGEIPAGWEIGRISGYYSLRNTKVSDQDYMPLSVTNKGIVPQLDTVAKTNAHDARKLVKTGDFVINSRSDRRGACGISAYNGSVSLINTVLSPREKMNPEFFDWMFHTIQFADEFYKWGHGIVDDLWTTNWQDMKKISIPVPLLQEQDVIASFLNAKCSEIDQVIAQKQEQLSTLADYKKSLIYEYVTGKKEVPAS